MFILSSIVCKSVIDKFSFKFILFIFLISAFSSSSRFIFRFWLKRHFLILFKKFVFLFFVKNSPFISIPVFESELFSVISLLDTLWFFLVCDGIEDLDEFISFNCNKGASSFSSFFSILFSIFSFDIILSGIFLLTSCFISIFCSFFSSEIFFIFLNLEKKWFVLFIYFFFFSFLSCVLKLDFFFEIFSPFIPLWFSVIKLFSLLFSLFNFNFLS